MSEELTKVTIDKVIKPSGRTVGHRQAMSLMGELLELTESYRTDLVNAKVGLDNSKDKYKKDYLAFLDDINKRTATNCDFYKRECQENIKRITSKKKDVPQIKEACEAFVNRVSHSMMGGILDTAKKQMRILAASEEKLDKSIADTVKAYEDLRDAKIEDAENKRKMALSKAQSDYSIKDNEFDVKYEESVKNISAKYQKAVDSRFSKQRIIDYCNALVETEQKEDTYTNPVSIPSYVKLGTIGFVLPNRTKDDNTIVQTLDSQLSDYVVSIDNEYVLEIPYAQRVLDGVSLLMKYDSSTESNVLSYIQPLLMKLFMSFPAGKLEATMIDPTRLGATFADVVKIAEGANSNRVINSRVWSKEQDIELALARIRVRMEELMRAYGNDKESRLSKEVITALAITDFPRGFSDSALRDLITIVRNSAAIGVCVFICANEDELKKATDRSPDLFREILSNLFVTTANGDKLIADNTHNSVYINLSSIKKYAKYDEDVMTQIKSNIDSVQLKVEYFDSMFNFDIYDSKNWFGSQKNDISIPIGIEGTDSVVRMVLGRQAQQHALVSGLASSGKTNFLHTLIMSTLISYTPDEVQMYLLDFKEGIEFNIYTRYRLPSLRMISLKSENEFGLKVLTDLCNELENRKKIFVRHNVTDIDEYRALNITPMPRLLLIADDIQELFRDKGDANAAVAECLSCISKIANQGRNFGIHMLFACQDFAGSGIEQFISKMTVRLAIKGSEAGAASVLGGANNGIRLLQTMVKGAAIYNNDSGNDGANQFLQICFMENSDRVSLLEKLDEFYNDPVNKDAYANCVTKVLLSNAEEDINNCFNQLITNGKSSITRLGEDNSYGLNIGFSINKKADFLPSLTATRADNVLIIGNNEKAAVSMFDYSVMSIIYDKISANSPMNDSLVYLIDLCDAELSEYECGFDYLAEQFPSQIKYIKLAEIESTIDELYNLALERIDNKQIDSNRVFLMFFGLNRARKLKSASLYDNGEIDSIEKLKFITSRGCDAGINCIFWSENISGVESILGDRFDSSFNKRIVIDSTPDVAARLVDENSGTGAGKNTAIYLDIAKDLTNTRFRPYDIPDREWIKAYAGTCNQIIKEDS